MPCLPSPPILSGVHYSLPCSYLSRFDLDHRLITTITRHSCTHTHVANCSTLPAESIPSEWQQYFASNTTTATQQQQKQLPPADIVTTTNRTIVDHDYEGEGPPHMASSHPSPPATTYTTTSPAGGELLHHTTTTGGYSTSHGSKYTYTYESHVEEPECSSLDYAVHSSSGPALSHPDDGTEKHEQTSQKVTRVTKITTTRSVKQVPVDPNDLCFDAEGNPMLANGEWSRCGGKEGRKNDGRLDMALA